MPYLGEVRHADIFILSLNPGFKPADYFAEYCVPSFRERRKRNLHQKQKACRFPNMSLDPAFSWHSKYWLDKLRDLATVIADIKYDGQYLKALEELSQRIAMLELVPYHSSAFSDHWAVNELASTNEVLKFARTELLSRAKDGRATVIVTRQTEAWSLRSRNVINYEKAESRGASLGRASRGGKAILERILKK